MKTIFSLLTFTIMFSCSYLNNEEQKQNQCTKYACPIHPDKTGTKKDNCPECGMEMVPADSVKTDSSVAHACCKKMQERNS